MTNAQANNISSATSFPAFTRLPTHIAQRILVLACRSAPSSCHPLDAAKRGRLELDAGTTTSLARVSKAINKVIIPILWTSIRIVKPSALIELAAAVEARPVLAQRIKNLHFGGDEMQVTSEWPLGIEVGKGKREMALCLKTTLSYNDMEERLPKWCMPDRAFPLLESTAGLDGRERAVCEALNTALQYIDVDPYKREYGLSGEWIGLEHWGLRIHELQACLDFYLTKMRKIEDARKYDVPDWTALKRIPVPAAGRYPTVKITGFISPLSMEAAKVKVKSTADVFVMTRAQFWKHLTRRGSAFDQFDHPVLWGRTGLLDHPFNENGEKMVQCFFTGPHWNLFKADEKDKEKSKTETKTNKARSKKEDRHPMQGEDIIIEALNLAPKWTLVGLVKTAHNIIGRALRLENLSLTGTFELSLAVPLPTFETLKSLSLGPHMPALETSAHFNNRLMTLRSLENLRVCGPMLHPLECQQIAGERGFLPDLKRVIWELIEPCKVGMDPGCHSTQYLGRGTLLQGSALLPGSTKQKQKPIQPRLIEMRLHPKAWPGVFTWRTPTTDAECRQIFPSPVNSSGLDLTREGEKRRSSWLKGEFYVDAPQGRKAPNRVVCTESVAAGMGREGLDLTVQDREGMRVLVGAAREWWEECAVWGEREGSGEGDEMEQDWQWWPGKRWGRPFVLGKEGKK